MRFKVFWDECLIGETELEFGDPPMGVAHGQFFPNSNYKKFHHILFADFADNEEQRFSNLKFIIKSEKNIEINAQHTTIEEIGFEEEIFIEIYLLGIDSEEYESLFPGRYLEYEEQFKS